MTASSLHPALVEQAVKDTLQQWLPSHLARIERENGLEPRVLPQPRSWPISTEFDLRPHEQLPAVFIVSTGKRGATRTTHGWRATWGCEVVVVLAAENEDTARRIAGMYLAAVDTVLLWHQTLDGISEQIDRGLDDLAVGNVGRSGRAIFGAAYDIHIPQSITRRPPEEPPTPPSDPYEPPTPVEPFDSADITVTPETLTEELA